MKEEFQEKIATKYPFMRRRPLKNPKVIDDLYSAFGMEFGDGWYQLIDDMCKEITNAFAEEKQEVNIVVDQAKEKFGSLRFYYHFDDEPIDIHAFDIIGPDSIKSNRVMPRDNSLYEKVAEIVLKYEDKSGTICEICGCNGETRIDMPWIRTLCINCYNKVKGKYFK